MSENSPECSISAWLVVRRLSVVRRCKLQETIRRFLCVGCRVVAYLCTACDRGQRYCSGECAREARRRSQRESDRHTKAASEGV
jgi:hypothetical protein